MKTYRAEPGEFTCLVTAGDGDTVYNLDPRLDLRNHSPTGISWGYEGSGPAQFALALLADGLDHDGMALINYQRFKREVIACASQSEAFQITNVAIKAWMETLK